MLKFGLSQNNIDRLAGIFSKYPAVEHVDIFGSRAKGTFRSGSDIDLAVFLKDHPDKYQFANLLWDVDASPIAFKIDLVDMNRLTNDKLEASIKRDGVRFYPPQNSDHLIIRSSDLSTEALAKVDHHTTTHH